MTFRRDLAWRHLEHVMHSSVSYQFARYALTLDYALIPESIRHQSKRSLLDALGCAIGAYESAGRDMLESFAKDTGGKAEATVFRSGFRTSAMNAALVNGYLINFLDYNDIGGCAHGSDGLASLLAVAEQQHASGTAFLTALVISYELGARFRDSVSTSAVTPAPGAQPSSLAPSPLVRKTLEEKGWTLDVGGGLCQPAAIGRLMGLDEEQIANAIGICASHALPLGVLDANREENTMAKNISFGWVSYDAILACMLARKGFTGPVRIVESESGLGAVVADGEMDMQRLIDFSGWRMSDVRFKSVPANGTTAAHVLATLQLARDNHLKPEDVAAVTIRTSMRESRHTTAPAKKYLRNLESAGHSAHFANAMAIKEHRFGPDSIRMENITDPVVLDLIDKIAVEGDPGYGQFNGSSEILTTDGRTLHQRIDTPRGMGNEPLTDAELESKFQYMASKHFTGEQVQHLIETCWNVDKLGDMGELTRLLVVQ